MSYIFVPYHLFSVIMIIACVLLSVYLCRSRKARGIRIFLFILALAIIWIGGQGLEFAAQKLDTKIFWANVQYFPISVLPILYFAMVLLYTGYDLLGVSLFHTDKFI